MVDEVGDDNGDSDESGEEERGDWNCVTGGGEDSGRSVTEFEESP